MQFAKMHGLGNDFLIVDAARQTIDSTRLQAAAPRLCDRHFGVGADGVLLLTPSSVADFRMQLFNADGSEAEMCGNGIRCFGKFIYDSGLKPATALTIETLAGIQRLRLVVPNGRVVAARVDMGEPRLSPAEIPTTLDPTGVWTVAGTVSPIVCGAPLLVDGRGFRVTCVSMGNPHCVIFVDNAETVPFLQLGPRLETHPAFPQRTNVHFVQIISMEEMRMKIWERGAGPTLACGTGACAALAAAVLNGMAGRQARVHLPGGTLEIEWADDDHLFMTGPAETVYEGEVEY